MAKPWEYESRRAEQLRGRAAFRTKAATSAFTRLAGNSLRQRGIDPTVLTPSKGLEDNERGTDDERFSRTVKRLTSMGMLPDDAVKQVRRYLDVTARRENAGMVRPRTLPQPGLDAAQQRRDRPSSAFPPSPSPSGIFLDRVGEQAVSNINRFRTDLAREGYEPWMVDTQLEGQFRLAQIIEQKKVNFPAGVFGATYEEAALEQLDDEMGDRLREAAPEPEKKKGLFSKAVSIAFKGTEALVFGRPGGARSFLKSLDVATGAGDEAAFVINREINRFLDTPMSQRPSREEVGLEPILKTFEEGKEVSRPAVEAAQSVLAEPFEQIEAADIPVVSPVAGKVSDAIQSQIVEDIASEIINPVALLSVAPFAMAGTTTAAGARLTGRALALQVTSNLLGTGLEPALMRGTLRGLTALRLRGLTALQEMPKAIRETSVIQQALRGIREAPEAGRVRIPGTPRQQAILAPKEALQDMPKRMLDDIASRIGAVAGRTRAQVIDNIIKVQAKEAPAVRKVLATAAREQDASLKVGVKQAVAAPGPEAPVGRSDIVGPGLDAAAVRTERAQLTSLRRNVLQATKPRKSVSVGLKPHERDPVGVALERMSEAPDNPVALRSRRDFPELTQFDDQLETALRFRDDARESLKFNRSAVKAGLLSPSRVDDAEKLLRGANAQLKASRAILKEAKVRATRNSVMSLVRSVGGSDDAAGIIGRAFDASASMVPHEDTLLTAASWRQRIARGMALVKGRVFRGVGLLADQRLALVDALHLQAADEVDDLFRSTQNLLKKESKGLTFTGPAKYKEMAEGEYRLYHIVQHPDWFAGKSAKLDGLLTDAQLVMRGRLEQARALGYPIEALDGAYLEQLWDIPRAALETPVLRARGKVSIAKQRWFDDYFEGLSKGGKPVDLTVEELMQHSSRLLDEAIGDAWMRLEVLRRYGTRTAKVPALKGSRKFGNPLYQGWSAPQDVTSAIDRLYQPVGTGARGIGDVAATMKNTAFGLVDIAVGGVQFPLSMAHGGFQIGVGTLNRSLQALGMPYMHVALQDPAVVGRVTQYAEDGLHIGIGPSSVRLKSGTIFKYIPIAGKYIDMPFSKTIDFMARVQFGHALTSLRIRMHEGNLIALKMIGQDVADPAVRKLSAEWANAGTGASRGAQTPGRRAAESFALTSAPMTRANLAVYAQLAEGLTVGGRMQKLRTALVLTNLAAYTYGMQYLINGVFGDGPQEWQPGKPDWATVRINGTTIPLMPQRTIARAIDKSINIITEGVEGEGWRPEDIALAWAQVGIGKASPAVQAMLSPFGVGFEPETGRFHMGGLSPKGRALGVPPTPPLAEQIAFQETDVMSLTLAGVGFNPYPTSPNKLLREEWKETTGKDFNDEVDWIVADNHPELSAEFSPMVAASNASSLKWGSLSALRRERMEEFRAEEEVKSGLEQDAVDFLAGEDVGQVLLGDWLDHQAAMSAAISFAIFGEDREPETPEGKALRAWGEVQPDDEKYRDPITRDVDRDAYRADKEAAFDVIRQVYPELADSLEARIRAVSPNLVKVEPEILAALDSLSNYRRIDRWFGIDKAMENKVEDIHQLVEIKRDEFALQGYLEISGSNVYRTLMEERPDISRDVWQAAWTVRPGADVSYRNPEADRYLIANEDELRKFFPRLYRRELLSYIGSGISPGGATGRQLSPALRARLGLTQ